MNVQAQAVSRAVKKTLHAPFDSSRRKAAAFEE